MSEYDTDVAAWSERQGALLRRIATGERVNDADLDWPNIAEEIESVGRSERSAVSSHISTVIEHLLKLQISPATEPRGGWRESVVRARGEIERLLEDSPSLRPMVGGMVAREHSRARRLARAGLASHGETPHIDPALITYSEGEVLGDWWPDAGSPA
jgi:hypothetical protein